MKRARKAGSANKVYFLEEKGNNCFLVINSNTNQRQRVSLRKGALFLYSDKSGIMYVSDGNSLFYIRNGVAQCSYKALHKINDVQCFDGKAMLIDGNMVFSFDSDGMILWHYIHDELIIQMEIEDDVVHLLDKNSSSFRLLLKNGKPDKRDTSSTSWTRWDMGKEGWGEKLSVLMEDLSEWNEQRGNKTNADKEVTRRKPPSKSSRQNNHLK